MYCEHGLRLLQKRIPDRMCLVLHRRVRIHRGSGSTVEVGSSSQAGSETSPRQAGCEIALTTLTRPSEEDSEGLGQSRETGDRCRQKMQSWAVSKILDMIVIREIYILVSKVVRSVSPEFIPYETIFLFLREIKLSKSRTVRGGLVSPRHRTLCIFDQVMIP
jgi:hypothetical protein